MDFGLSPSLLRVAGFGASQAYSETQFFEYIHYFVVRVYYVRWYYTCI